MRLLHSLTVVNILYERCFQLIRKFQRVIAYTVDESQLRDLFTAYGEIEILAMIMDRETGRTKGFAFIIFSTQQAAEKALEQNGKDIGGRALKVNMATEKPSRGRGGRSRW